MLPTARSDPSMSSGVSQRCGVVLSSCSGCKCSSVRTNLLLVPSTHPGPLVSHGITVLAGTAVEQKVATHWGGDGLGWPSHPQTCWVGLLPPRLQFTQSPKDAKGPAITSSTLPSPLRIPKVTQPVSGQTTANQQTSCPSGTTGLSLPAVPRCSCQTDPTKSFRQQGRKEPERRDGMGVSFPRWSSPQQKRPLRGCALERQDANHSTSFLALRPASLGGP